MKKLVAFPLLGIHQSIFRARSYGVYRINLTAQETYNKIKAKQLVGPKYLQFTSFFSFSCLCSMPYHHSHFLYFLLM